MQLHRLEADTEDVGNLFACAALRDELNDLALARRENGWASACSIGVKQDFRDLVGEEGLMSGNGLDGLDQVMVCIGLQEITTRTGFEELIDQHLGVMHREDENFSGCKTTVELARHFDAIDYWKGVVDDGNVRPRFDRSSDCLLTIRSLSNDLPIRLGFEDAADPQADDLVIVGN